MRAADHMRASAGDELERRTSEAVANSFASERHADAVSLCAMPAAASRSARPQSAGADWPPELPGVSHTALRLGCGRGSTLDTIAEASGLEGLAMDQSGHNDTADPGTDATARSIEQAGTTHLDSGGGARQQMGAEEADAARAELGILDDDGSDSDSADIAL